MKGKTVIQFTGPYKSYRDQPSYKAIEIYQPTVKKPGDLIMTTYGLVDLQGRRVTG